MPAKKSNSYIQFVKSHLSNQIKKSHSAKIALSEIARKWRELKMSELRSGRRASPTVKKSRKLSSRKSVDSSTERTPKKSARKSAKKSVKKSVKKSAKKSAKKSVKKSVKKSAKKSAEKSAEKSAKKSAEKSAKKSARKSAHKHASPGRPQTKKARRCNSAGVKRCDKLSMVCTQNKKHTSQYCRKSKN